MVMLLIRIYVVVWFLVDDLPLRRYDQIVLPRHQGDPAGSWVASSTSYEVDKARSGSKEKPAKRAGKPAPSF